MAQRVRKYKKAFYVNRKMAEDFREKMIINARKNVPLQYVPYFDVQNTDERIETQSHYEVKMRHNQHI